MTATSYTIKLAQFEGPFDLLLFFIERDELDIHDIPISKITNDFLEYVRRMESLNIDLASEFILVAATLMRIKAKMLLPRKEVDEDGNEIDPREELVARLMEYKRYKEVLDDMRKLEENRSFRHYRGNVSSEMQHLAQRALVNADVESITLFKLLKTFEKVMTRLEDSKAKSIHRVYRYSHTVQGQQQFLLSKLKVGEQTDFATIFGNCENRMHAVITFLALLELLNLQRLKVTQGIGENNFWMEVNPDYDAEAVEKANNDAIEALGNDEEE